MDSMSNPFADAIDKNNVKRKHRTTFLKKLKANKASDDGVPHNTKHTESPTLNTHGGSGDNIDVAKPIALMTNLHQSSQLHNVRAIHGLNVKDPAMEGKKNADPADIGLKPTAVMVQEFFHQKNNKNTGKDTTNSREKKTKKVTIRETNEDNLLSPNKNKPKQSPSSGGRWWVLECTKLEAVTSSRKN